MNGIPIAHLERMRHSPIHNYIVPGLTSWLIGAPSPHGCVRLFECHREHEEAITPHSHRFDFECLVLRGTVRNRVWGRWGGRSNADQYRATKVVYGGKPGSYVLEPEQEHHFWNPEETVYVAGSRYGMRHDRVHSIFFSRGALVLFFEGPNVADHSIVLEPVVLGKPISTFAVLPWMFEREGARCDRNHWVECSTCNAFGVIASVVPSVVPDVVLPGTAVCPTCHGAGGWRCPGCAAAGSGEGEEAANG